jgi:hypothetical protein
METYLFDPLNVGVSLRTQHPTSRAPDIHGVEVPNGQEAFVRNLSPEDLQRIADTVLEKVKAFLNNLCSNGEEREEVVFVNGTKLRYPHWFLYRDDKEIEGTFQTAFGQHLIQNHRLLSSYAILNMAPKDLLDLYKEIQASGNP